MSFQAKDSLRKQIQSKLSTLTPEQITSQSQKAQDLILNLPHYQKATRLSIYLSMPHSEAQTTTLIHHALDTGKKVFIPYIHSTPTAKGPQKIISMLRLNTLAEYQGLKADKWGIPSLSSDAVEERENAMGGVGPSIPISGSGDGDGDGVLALHDVEHAEGRGEDGRLDLVVLPGVGFDEGGNRLGHGKGFYDGFLTRFCGDGTGKPYLVGLCLAEQLLPPGQEIPMTEDDWIVDAVAAGDGRVLCVATLPQSR